MNAPPYTQTFQQNNYRSSDRKKNLAAALEELDVHDHLCLIYETQEEQFAAVIPFMRIGLERGEKCLYIVDDNTAATVMYAMREAGIDVDESMKSEALAIVTKKEAYLKQGYFDPDWMITFLKETTEIAKASGFNALRVTGEMTWILGGEPGVERLIEYESKLNYAFPIIDALAICQYNKKRFSPKIIRDVISTHPLIVYGETVCKNFYYVPPDEFLALRDDESFSEINRLLKNILDREEAESMLTESEARYHLLVEQIPAITYISALDQSSSTLYISPQVEQMLGFATDEWMKDPDLWVKQLHPYDRERVLAEVAHSHASGELFRSEYRLLSRDGHTVWVRDEAVIVHEETGHPLVLQGVMSDITERKKAEETALAQFKLAETFFNHSVGCLVILDRDFNFVRVNEAYAHACLRDISEFVGRNHFDMYPSDAKLIFDDVVRTKHPFTTFTRAFVFPDQPERGVTYWDWTLVPILDQQGEVEYLVFSLNDVTERKRAEEALHRLNRELRAISDCNQTLLRAIDEQTLLNDICRIVCDKAGYRLAWVGYAEHDDAKTVRPVAWAGSDSRYIAHAKITWADDTERGRGPSGTAIRSGEIVYVQDFTTDPQAVPWRENALQRGYRSSIALPLKDHSANTFGVLNIYSTEPSAFTPAEIRLLEELSGDLAFGITTLRIRAERKRMDEALRQSEADLKEAQRVAQIGSWDWDATTDTIRWSEEYYRIYNIDPNLPAPNYLEHLKVYTHESRERLNTAVEKAMQTGESYELDLELMHPNITTRWIVARSEVKRNASGTIVGLRGTVQNITERKQAEMELLKFRLGIERSDEVIFITDPDGKILYVNPAFENIYGYSKEEVLGSTPRILKSGIISEDTYKEFWETLLVKKVVGGEIVNKTKDGRLIDVENSANPILNESGNIIGFLAVQHDITERKRKEKELIYAKERAEHSDKLKDAFIANISHEIRTPLNVILGFTNLVEETFYEKSSPQEKSFFKNIDSGAQRLMRTVDLILNISRVQAGEYTLNISRFNLSSAIEKLVHQMQPEAEKKSLFLEFKNEYGLAFITADEYCITEAICNLINNAIKFTRRGSITINLYRNSNGEPCLDVSDTGVGISDEYLPHLFEPYSQEEVGYTRGYEGIGLGLALVKRYLDLLAIPISVKSKKHAGTRFTLNFRTRITSTTDVQPSPILQTYEKTHDAYGQSPKQRRAKVLAVEDDKETINYLKIILQQRYDVLIVDNAEDAWGIIRSLSPDIILMDISIQGAKTGLDLTREIRASQEYSTLPIIAVTAHAFPRDRENCLQAGCNVYITKPMSKTKLFDVIDTLINQYKKLE